MISENTLTDRRKPLSVKYAHSTSVHKAGQFERCEASPSLSELCQSEEGVGSTPSIIISHCLCSLLLPSFITQEAAAINEATLG
jgi:hypothetical protein